MMKRILPGWARRFYERDLAHNSVVQANLEQVRQIVDSAAEPPALLAGLRALGDDYPLQYKNTVFWWSLLLLLPLFLLVIGWVIMLVEQHESDGFYAILLVPGLLLFWLFSRYKSDPYPALAESVQQAYEQLKYGFVNRKDQQDFTFEQLAHCFNTAFKRGNHANEFPRYASGTLQNMAGLPFTVFNYHYVNRRTERYTENGKIKTRTVYDHFDRWGMFVAGVQPLGVAVTAGANSIFPHSWKTSSIDFNKHYSISGASELELARLFQPVNLQLFERCLAKLPGFDLRFSAQQPVLYLGCDSNVFTRQLAGETRALSPAQLAEQLEGLRLPVFEQLLERLQPLLQKMVK